MRAMLARAGVLAWLIAAAPAWAQGPAPADDPNILLSADQILYDRNLETVTASGRVEISSGERVLLADRVHYSLRDDVVTASGNISLLEPDGSVAFAEYMQVDRELSDGFIRGVRLLFADNSRAAAASGTRSNGNRTTLNRAVYSPCSLCPNNPRRPPLWQIKAVRVVHNRESKHIDYQDAFLEFYGIPVAYVPFFRHADPTVKRKSGFLAPSFGTKSDFGVKVQTPYFFNIAPNRDFTFSPIFTSKEGVVLVGEYRALTENGNYQIEGSATRVDKRDLNNTRLNDKINRGHIDATGRFDASETWRWGFDLERTTDDTYLRRYDFDDADTLTSSVFIEGFSGRNYAALSSYAFQGLREDDDPGTTPLVAPLLDYGYVFAPRLLGGELSLDASAVSLYRSESTDTRRASAGLEWQRGLRDGIGSLYTLSGQLRGDLYWVSDVQADPSQPNRVGNNGIRSRVRPTGAFEWRFPLVAGTGSTRQVIEPIVQGVISPYGGNPASIPNEDSVSFEFDDTNLFSLERFPGYDRVEGGPRVNYGVKAGIYGANGGYTTAVFGGVLRAKEDDTFPDNTGLDDNFSDYVARLTIAPTAFFDLTNRVRISRDRLALRRNEVYLSLGPKALRLETTYVSLDRELAADELGGREELFVAARAQLTPHWSARGFARRDLTGDGRQIKNALEIAYRDECIFLSTSLERDFTRDRDLEPSTSLNFRIVLRHLG